MKKVIFVLTLITLFLCVLPFGAYASDFEEEYSDILPLYTTEEEINSNNQGIYTTFPEIPATNDEFTPVSAVSEGKTSNETAKTAIENSGENTLFENTAPTKEENTAKSKNDFTTESQNNEKKAWSDTILTTAEEYTSEIFCIMTFLGSLITAFCYKRGLLPTLADGINKIYSVVVKAGEKTNSMQAESAELLDAFVDRAMPILEKAKEVSEYAEKLHEESLSLKDEIEREKAQRRVLSHILSGQIDMLYGVFMSANLPEYQKEQLGAQYNRLRSMISEGEENENEN